VYPCGVLLHDQTYYFRLAYFLGKVSGQYNRAIAGKIPSMGLLSAIVGLSAWFIGALLAVSWLN
jgi:hypothetical protein